MVAANEYNARFRLAILGCRRGVERNGLHRPAFMVDRFRPLASGRRMIGTVISFDPARRFGIIRAHGDVREYFFHRDDASRDFGQGDVVSFECVERTSPYPGKRPSAKNVRRAAQP
jgi:cold shock CspA family protein